MKKPTFREFLKEVDYGDHAIQKSVELDKQRATDDEDAKSGFNKRMAQATPSKGDVIQSKTGYYIITGMDREGIHVKQAGGNKSGILQHGTKFKNIGTTSGGKPKFAVI